jgi:hypothetical protein
MHSFYSQLSFCGFAAEKGPVRGVPLGAWFVKAHQVSAVHVLGRGYPGGNAQRFGFGLSVWANLVHAKSRGCLFSNNSKPGLNLTRRSTRTQPLPSTMLFLVHASQSLFRIRSAAGPVNFQR